MRRSFWMSSILLSFFSLSVFATSFSQVPFENRVKDADLIVRGKILSIKSDWAEDSQGNHRIYTFYDLAVSEVIKGQTQADGVSFRQMGGEVGSSEMRFPGTAEFYEGEDVLLLLKSESERTFELRSFEMGKYKVREQDGALEGPGVSSLDPHHINIHGAKKWTLFVLREFVKKQKENKALSKEMRAKFPETPEAQIEEEIQTPSEENLPVQETLLTRVLKSPIAVSLIILLVCMVIFRTMMSRRRARN